MIPATVPRSVPFVVTHVITRLIVGGAQENTVSTVLGLQSRPEFRANLLSGPTTGPEGSIERTFDSKPELLRIVPSLVRPVSPFRDFQAVFDLRREFRRSQPAIVHTHSGKAGIIGRWAAHLERVPIIVHGIHGPSFGPWQGAVSNAIFRTAERQTGPITTHFIAVANAMIEQYLAAGIGSSANYTRIFSGFDLAPFLGAKNDPDFRARLGIAADDLVIGKIARLFQLKGHDDLFIIAPDLVRRFPNARFLLVGGGAWEDRFRKLAASLGLERNFIFTGLVPPSQIPALTGIMDLLVHVSLREGLARALPQAMAAGKPVVAYACDGAGEVCLDGQTGFLVPVRDRQALLRSLVRLLGDSGLRSRFGWNGSEFVRERFQVERMVEETGQLYLKLLRDHRIQTAPGS
ncbi:MAG TPA: glycosyltransferase [Verrucomicrobiae bacterium]|nr:glycosyltransferase [Verrucomicrobiae bacterium]